MKSGIHSTETIVAGLTSRSTAKFAAAFEAAQALGDQGEKYFAEAWPHLDGYRKVSVAASLGSSRGDHGLAILREGIRTTGPKSTDVVCASLYALAKREGRDANDLLDNAYRDLRSFFARHYAEIGLAAVGDDRTWDLMLARLSKRLLVKKRMDATPPEIATPLAYLLRHSTNQTDRLSRLAAVLKLREKNLHDLERSWLQAVWPEVFSSQDPPPIVHAALQKFLREDPMIRAVIANDHARDHRAD